MKILRSTHLVLVTACLVLLAVGATEALAAVGDPLPGIDVLVRKKPGDKRCLVNLGGASTIPGCPADFFGPGSDPFTGEVTLGCPDYVDPDSDADDCGVSLSYVETASSETVGLRCTPLSLRSVDPIHVLVNGVDSFFDVWVEVLNQDPIEPPLPVEGEVTLPSGVALDPGTSSLVVGAFMDVRCRVTFTEAGTGNPAGSVLETNLRLDLQNLDCPITRLSDVDGGLVVLGYDGSNVQTCLFGSSATGLRLGLDANLAGSPVATTSRSFGAVKASYR